jgi:hypothetical protein
MGDGQTARFQVGPDRLREIEQSLNTAGYWLYDLELRMGAGPTLEVKPDSERTGYQVTVTWGSQRGEVLARTLERAVELAYRMSHDFLEARSDSAGDIL